MSGLKPLNDDQKAWMSALESGEYKRGTLALCIKMEDGTIRYCCLGVAAKALFPYEEWTTPFDGCRLSPKGWLSSSYLPPDVAERLGVTTDQMRLSTGNDSAAPDDLTYEAVIPTIKQIWREKGYDV